jgi:outer membrane protein
MKKFFFIVLIGLMSFSTFAIVLGKVDVQKILITVEEGKKVRKKLKIEFDKKQKELKSEEAAIRKLQEDFKKQNLVLNDKAKMTKQQMIQASILKLQQKTMAYQKTIQKLEGELKRPILNKVRKVIIDVSKKEGVEFTFEISTSPIIYAKTQKDLTDKVIKAYNKLYKN